MWRSCQALLLKNGLEEHVKQDEKVLHSVLHSILHSISVSKAKR